MENIFKLLLKLSSPRIPVPLDKQAHFICGLIIAAVLTPFIGWYSVVLVSMVATAKEKYDAKYKDKHTADVWDFVATTLGGLVGFALITIIL
jgi:hypothetical protein